MTDPGHVGSADVAPPPFASCREAALSALRRALDVEAPRFRQPADALAEFARGRLQRPAELDDRRHPRLPAGPLQQRNLGTVQIAHVTELFLGDPGGEAGPAEVDGEAVLRVHR